MSDARKTVIHANGSAAADLPRGGETRAQRAAALFYDRTEFKPIRAKSGSGAWRDYVCFRLNVQRAVFRSWCQEDARLRLTYHGVPIHSISGTSTLLHPTDETIVYIAWRAFGL